MLDEMRRRAAQLRAKETNPIQCEAYALAERAGFDWYDTESAARRMAEHAAKEVVALRTALRAANKLIGELEAHLNYTGWGDSWERECSEKLRAGLTQRRAQLQLAALAPKHRKKLLGE